MARDPKQWLLQTMQDFSCQTATLHRSNATGTHLELVACHGVPDVLLEKITLIPFGKGIAGAAAELREPIELCNLQQNLGEHARPDARLTQVAGSLAVPIIAHDDQRVLGVVGIGKHIPYEFSDAEKAALLKKSMELQEDFNAQG